MSIQVLSWGRRNLLKASCLQLDRGQYSLPEPPSTSKFNSHPTSRTLWSQFSLVLPCSGHVRGASDEIWASSMQHMHSGLFVPLPLAPMIHNLI